VFSQASNCTGSNGGSNQLTACASCTPGRPPPSGAVHPGLRSWGQASSGVRSRPAVARCSWAPLLAPLSGVGPKVHEFSECGPARRRWGRPGDGPRCRPVVDAQWESTGVGDLRPGSAMLAQLRAFGCVAMDEDQADWWMDARKRWRRGRPPAGWWQGDDRRWHSPDDEYQPGTNVAYRPPARPARFVGGPPSPSRVRWRGRLARVFYVVVAVAVVVTVTVAVVAALAVRSGAWDDGGTTSTAAGSTVFRSSPSR
jgi:hypothetical protein